MNTMTRDEMIEFLKGMDCRKKLLDEEKSRISTFSMKYGMDMKENLLWSMFTPIQRRWNCS